MKELLFKQPQDYMSFELELRKARRPGYSMRAFARDLGMSPSGLNDFMKGRVGMSKAKMEDVALKLHWSQLRSEHFADLVGARFDKDPGIRKSSSMRVRLRLKDGSIGLSVDAFKAISDWHHLVILELCSIKNNLEITQIAEDLKLPSSTITDAIHRLKKLKLLHTTPSGLKPTDRASYFGDEQPSEAVIEFHSQILGLAQKALKEKSMRERESHSLVFAVKNEDVAKMNLELKKAVYAIANRYSKEDDGDRIQVLSLQTFPVWSSEK